MSDSTPLQCLKTVATFCRRNPHIFASEQSVRWYLRDRDTNGLLETGAVVELRASKDSQRPRVFIDEARFLEWMRGRGMIENTSSGDGGEIDVID